MKRIKISSLTYQIIVYGFVIFSCCFFVWSEFGLLQHYTVGQELASKQQELISMRSEIDSIKQEIACWKSDPFYLEKMAREELGMGYKNEVMYLTR